MEEFNAWLRRNVFLQALALTLIAMGTQLALTTPVYTAVDDVLMTGIVSGNLGVTEPSDKIVHSNVLLARVLMNLYAWMPAIPWYGYYLIGTHVISFLMLSWVGLQLLPGWRTIGVLLLYLYGVETECLRHLSFTTTSYLAAQSGVLLIVSQIARPYERKVSLQIGLGIAFLVLSSLIRLQIFQLVLCLSLPLFGSVMLKFRERFILRRCSTVLLLLGTVVSGLAYLNDSAYLNNSVWRQYMELRGPLAQVVDYTKLNARQIDPKKADEILNSVGWSFNDLVTASAWCFVDEDVYSVEKLELVARGWQRLQRSDLRFTLQTLLHSLGKFVLSPFCWGCFLATLCFRCHTGARFEKWAILATWITAASLIVYLAAEKKLPERVSAPIVLFTMLVTIVLPLIKSEWNTGLQSNGDVLFSGVFPKWKYCAVLMLAVVSFTIAQRQALSESHKTAQINKRFWRSVEALGPDRHRMIVGWPGFGLDEVSPFDDLRPLSRLNLLPLLPYQRTPHAEMQKQAFGVRNPIKSLYEENGTVIIAAPLNIQRLMVFIQEHYHQRVEFRPVPQGRSGFVVYRAFLSDSTPRKDRTVASSVQ